MDTYKKFIKGLDMEILCVYTPFIMKENLRANELSRYEVAKCTECTGYNLRKATRVVQNMFDNAFKPVGLEGTQFTVLSVIFVNGPISLTKAADLMNVDRTTLARNLKPLERKGLVEVAAGSDRRTRNLNITIKGKEVLSEALPVWKGAQEKIKTALGLENWDSMISNLNKLVAQVEEK